MWVAQQTKTNLGQVIEVEHKTRAVLTLPRGRGMRGLNDKQYLVFYSIIFVCPSGCLICLIAIVNPRADLLLLLFSVRFVLFFGNNLCVFLMNVATQASLP